MFLVKLLFFVLIIVCAVFYILYIWDFSLVLLIVMVSLPVLMFVTLIITKKSISVQFVAKKQTASKDEEFEIRLSVSNKSFFHVGKAEALIDYYNIFNNKINNIEFHFPIQARNNQQLSFMLKSKFCGIIKIKSASIYIYDPLRLFKFRIGRNISENIVILPAGYEISGVISAHDHYSDESLVFSEHRPGDDPSEVFDLREYSPGDKLNRIHWKLSSKKDEFIVKDYSYPVDSPITVFLDLRCCEDSEYTLPIYDTLFELLVSVSQFLLEDERMHKIIYYSSREKQFACRIVNNIDSLSAVINEILLSLSDDVYSESPELYFSENPVNDCASFTIITAEYNEKLFGFIDNELDADIKNAVITVKTPVELDSCSHYSYSSLNTIPVVIGRITSSVRDIEL